MTISSKDILLPELDDALATLKRDVLKNINCVKIGTIQKFDSTKKTVEVQIVFKRVLPDETTRSMPILVDCPVFTLQGGGGALTFPIEAGDECVVLFADRNIDAWFANGGQAAPFDGRLHDLSDGIALVGLNYEGSTFVEYSANEVALKYLLANISLKGGKVIVSNAATDLKLVLTGLIDVIKTLQVVGPIPLTPASIAALEAYKLTIESLLASPLP